MIIGIRVMDTRKEAPIEELIIDAARMYEKRFGMPARLAEISDKWEGEVIVEGIEVRKVHNMPRHEATAGGTVMAEKYTKEA
jgi:hypothetical protein